MRITDPELLKTRARNLVAQGLNGLELLFVELIPPDAPVQAVLHVQFYNDIALTNIDEDITELRKAINDIFILNGGTRIIAGVDADQIHIQDVEYDSEQPLMMHLTTSSIGDYSTYTLNISYSNDQEGILIDPLFASLPFKFRPGCFNLNCATEPKEESPPAEQPNIDYLARDFDSIKHVLINAMRDRVPGWEPTSEASLDMVILDLLAADADELCDFQDRVMQEAYLGMARKRVSLARHARLMDYHIHQGNQAGTWLVVEVDLDTCVIPMQLPVWTGENWDQSASVMFITKDEQTCHKDLNRIDLYTWGNVVTALESGATEADLVVPGGVAAEDFSAQISNSGYLVIEEKLNPETGTVNGRDLNKRQLLRLLPGDEATEIGTDPVSNEQFIRVRWEPIDHLTETYCFVTRCEDEAPLTGISAFHGNLIYATHGRPHEVYFHPPGRELGISDDSETVRHDETWWEPGPWGAIATLPRGPLAYIDTLPGGDTAPVSTASVEVDNSDWEERIDLIESEDSDLHFMIETNEMGASSLRFGNGHNGKRLDNDAVITCHYQVGGGSAGNVGADSLTGFDPTAIDGLVSLRNPFDVNNGRDPESREEIIRRAPEAYRQRQLRAVTLADYVNRAEELPKVAHAYARFAWTGSWRTVQLSVDPIGGTELDDLSRKQIAAHLDAVRLIGDDLEVRPARYVALDIELKLCVSPENWPEDLETELQTAFSDGYSADGRPGFFHPDEWTFGQPLHASQIIGRALEVPGVERVLSLSMRRWNAGTGASTRIVEIHPEDLPKSLVERIEVQPFEIIQVANDPDHLERGRILFDISGGPQ